MLERSQRETLWLIVLAAFLLRLALVGIFQTWVLGDDWQFGYEAGRIARSLAVGEGFSSPFPLPSGPTAWLMPGYPMLVAAVFTTFGVYSSGAAILVIGFNCLVSALSCVPAFLISRRVFGISTAYLATCALALYPPSIWHAINTIWDTSLMALLALLMIHAFYRLSDMLTLRRVGLYGILSGAVTLVSPVVLPYVGCVGIWLIFRRRLSSAFRLSAVAVLTLGTITPLAPWLARNYTQFGRLTLRSNFGLELKLGNSPAAWDHLTGSTDVAPLYVYHPSQSDEEFRRFLELGEIVYLEQAAADARQYVSVNPRKALSLTLRRVQVFWLSDLGRRNDWLGRLDLTGSFSWLKKLCYLLPLPFMLLGIVDALKRRRPVGPLLAFIAVIPIVYYLTHVSERYRFIVEPTIVILAAYGATRLLEEAAGWWRRGRADRVEKGLQNRMEWRAPDHVAYVGLQSGGRGISGSLRLPDTLTVRWSWPCFLPADGDSLLNAMVCEHSTPVPGTAK